MAKPARPIGPRAKGKPRSKREFSKGNKVAAFGGFVPQKGRKGQTFIVWQGGRFYALEGGEYREIKSQKNIDALKAHFEV